MKLHTCKSIFKKLNELNRCQYRSSIHGKGNICIGHFHFDTYEESSNDTLNTSTQRSRQLVKFHWALKTHAPSIQFPVTGIINSIPKCHLLQGYDLYWNITYDIIKFFSTIVDGCLLQHSKRQNNSVAA